MALEWSKELDHFRKMTQEQQIAWYSQLLFLLSMFARDTYEVGTDGVSKPRELRRFNEVIHRLASQQLKIAKADTARMPDDQMFKLLEEEMSALAVDTSELLKRMLKCLTGPARMLARGPLDTTACPEGSRATRTGHNGDTTP